MQDQSVAARRGAIRRLRRARGHDTVGFSRGNHQPRATLTQLMATKKEATDLRRAPIPPGDEIGAADLARRVAENLREQRKRRSMSLDQLAQLTGVSRAALSQIETRKTNPTIGVLWKIAS